MPKREEVAITTPASDVDDPVGQVARRRQRAALEQLQEVGDEQEAA